MRTTGSPRHRNHDDAVRFLAGTGYSVLVDPNLTDDDKVVRAGALLIGGPSEPVTPAALAQAMRRPGMKAAARLVIADAHARRAAREANPAVQDRDAQADADRATLAGLRRLNRLTRVPR